MQTKHIFLFTLALGLVWTGILFAYSAGPDPAVNGVSGPTCNQAGCHNSFTLNSGTGSVAIEGLPAQWTPSQTYTITVRVALSTAVRFGFQFSAVSNTTNQQAGTLALSGDIRVSLNPILANGVRFVQHNSLASTNGVFTFNWTAPASASFGTVRFNAAGNGANNDTTSLGDRIYTTVQTRDALAGDTTPPVISGATAAAITVNSATINWTTDEASDSQVEFGTTTNYGQSTALNATMVTSHSVSLTGLASATTYHYRLKSRDAAGNLSTSGDFNLITPFSISNLGGVSRTTDGSGGLGIGYTRIQPATGSTTPSGVAIFGFRPAGILVSETGVPDSPLLTAGRIYTEVNSNGSVNTGLAIVNSNSTTANLIFTLRDNQGTRTRLKDIPPNGQIASFLTEEPYLSGNNIQGTLSFTSNVPVSVIALRGLYNERTPNSDFLMSTLPVIDTSVPASTGTQVIPEFAVGGGWSTQILLVNSTGTPQTGTVQFFNTVGAPVDVSIAGGGASSSGPYSVAADNSQKLAITSVSGFLVGSVRIVPTGGGPAPVPLVLFSFKPGLITVTEAGVPVNMGTAFRMYVESSAVPFISSGIAMANATATATTVNLQVTRLEDGAVLGTAQASLPASGQVQGFLSDFAFTPPLPASLKGVLRITTSTGATISVVGLRNRINERLPSGDFLITTTPPTLESGAPSSAARFFADFANGGGYTSQFILFSGTAGQAATGDLQFFTTAGAPLPLNIN